MFSPNDYSVFPLQTDIVFSNLSKKAADDFLTSLLQVTPSRVQLLRECLSLSSIDPWDIQSVHDALRIIAGELMKNARAEPLPRTRVEAAAAHLSDDIREPIVSAIVSGKHFLSPQLDAFCIDCSLLFSELLRARHPTTYWGVVGRSGGILKNLPALFGLGINKEVRPLNFASHDVAGYVNGRLQAIDFVKQFRAFDEESAR